jgi:hypothetical protein
VTTKRRIPSSLVTAERHVDQLPDDPAALVQTADGRVVPAGEVHRAGKRRERREKRSDKARGRRHDRRTARREWTSEPNSLDRGGGREA